MAKKNDGVKRPETMTRGDMLRDLSVVRGRATHAVSETERLNESINALSKTCASQTKQISDLEGKLGDLDTFARDINADLKQLVKDYAKALPKTAPKS